MIPTTVPNSSATSYEIVIKGRATAGLLRPLLDDFSFDRTQLGVTRLTAEIRDAAHRHGRDGAPHRGARRAARTRVFRSVSLIVR